MRNNKKFLAILPILLFFLWLGATLVSAAGNGNTCDSCGQPGDAACNPGLDCKDGKCRPDCVGICIENPIKSCSFEDLTNSIINFIFYIALAMAPLMIIIGAFYLLTAGADPKRVETGKNIILYTLIGFTLILLAKGLVALVKQFLD